jgi:hypothetical protein
MALHQDNAAADLPNRNELIPADSLPTVEVVRFEVGLFDLDSSWLG